MTDPIVFLLNGEARRVTDAAPTVTLLDWLRGPARLTGTKEGCNEGDCGACTVAARPMEGGPWRPLNACIQFLPMLHGMEIVTVEGIGPAVPRAFAEHHASQCGFCTPGFVMSLWVDRENGDDAPLNDVLAGNLCRCTGYTPIIRAGEALRADPGAETNAPEALDCAAALDYQIEGGRFQSPTTIEEAAAAIAAAPEATVLAGATDVGLWVTKQRRALPHLIWLGRVAALKEIRREGDCLWLGAGATYAEAWPHLVDLCHDFETLLRRLGAMQVRAAGTVGGNVANGSPIGDTPPALIALGATVVLRQGAARRELPLEDFFLAYGKQDRRPGEFVEGLRIPIPADPAQAKFYKISKRLDQDISALCGCFNLTLSQGRISAARVAFGGMAATPKRAAKTEAALVGQTWDEAAVAVGAEALAEDFSPIDDLRASAEYRLRVAQNLLRRYWLETTRPELQTRVEAL